MPYSPNANWNAATADLAKHAVYYVAIDGYTAAHFSSGPVKSPATTKKQYLRNITGLSQEIQPLTSRATTGEVSFELVDKDGEVTDLVATEAPGAAISSLVNRLITVYAGYADIVEADYAPIFTGYLDRLDGESGLWRFRCRDVKWLLDKEIMAQASEASVKEVRGNLVNVYWSILRNSFSLSGDFPLEYFDSGVTGIGIAASLIDEVGLKDERDRLLVRARGRFVFAAPVNARTWLESELFGAVGWPVVRADGKLGLRSLTTPRITASNPTLTESDVIGAARVDRRLDLHVNQVKIYGNYDRTKDTSVSAVLDAAAASGQKVIPLNKTDGIARGGVYTIQKADGSVEETVTVDTIQVGDTVTAQANLSNSYVAGDKLFSNPYKLLFSESDASDQSATGEVRLFEWKSKGLTDSVTYLQKGDRIAKKIGKRILRRYLKTPLEVEVLVPFTKRGVEVGDHVVVTHSKIPNMDTGGMGVTAKPFECIRVAPDFNRGVLRLTLLGSDFAKRRMFMAPVGTLVYLSEKGTADEHLGFLSNPATLLMSNGDAPYLIQ